MFSPWVRLRSQRPTRPITLLMTACLVVLVGGLGLVLTVPSLVHGAGSTPTIGRMDLHLDMENPNINVSLTATENLCGAPLNGQVCLRYTITNNDQPVKVGYGLIAASDIQMSGSILRLTTDTRTYPHFHYVTGSGGNLNLIWSQLRGGKPTTVKNRTSVLSPCTVQGSVLGYAIPSIVVTAGTLIYTT